MRLSTSLLAAAVAAGALLAHGCATVSSASITPDAVNLSKTVGGAARFEAHGTPAKGWVGRSLVKSDALRDAVRTAALSAGLFESVVDEGPADHLVTVTVVDLVEPEVSLDHTCEVSMRWRLSSGDGSRTVWEEVVRTKKTVNTYEEVDSHKRHDQAIEGAIRANVSEGLTRLANANG